MSITASQGNRRCQWVVLEAMLLEWVDSGARPPEQQFAQSARGPALAVAALPLMATVLGRSLVQKWLTISPAVVLAKTLRPCLQSGGNVAGHPVQNAPSDIP